MVLVLAGIDASGGAGLVADVATVGARGLHPAALPTALTLQDTRACRSVAPVDVPWLKAQLALVLDDFAGRVAAVKIGMLGDPAVAEAVAAALAPLVAMNVPLVLDPVLRATRGAALLAGDATRTLERLLTRTTIVTPNRSEAEQLTGLEVSDLAGQWVAANRLRALGAGAALVKGGHLAGPQVRDVLDDGQDTPLVLESVRVPGETPHGTGCALSTELACQLALGHPLRRAVARAHALVAARIAAAVVLGQGRPLLACPLGIVAPEDDP